MQSDESGTVAALDRARAVFRESVAACEGRIVDMAGDSVLAVFDSANSGVRCALAVQRTLLAGCLILAEVQARLAIPLEVAKTGLREGAALEVLSELAAA